MIKIFKLNNDNTKIKLLYSNNVFHPTETTSFLLSSVLKKININKELEILDLGCGNGIIGIFLLKKFKKIKKITFSDLSTKAVKLTEKNLKLNISMAMFKFFTRTAWTFFVSTYFFFCFFLKDSFFFVFSLSLT